MKPKIKIIGAGPAGIFAAHSLSQENKYNIELIDIGKDIEKRVCAVEKKKKCVNCAPCNVHQGFGGAGTMSDGKLNFDIRIGNNLGEIVSQEKNKELTNQVEDIFGGYGIAPHDVKNKILNELELKALQNGIEFIGVRNAHVGSEKLREDMVDMRNYLQAQGVKITTEKEIKDLSEIKYDKVILAPGRSGAKWIEKILAEKNIPYNYRAIDVGVRIEVPRQITDWITDHSRDMKFYLMSKRGDRVRTFCACPGGFVDIEQHDKFALVNGHAYANKESKNTNFAFLTTVELTQPQSNTNQYARRMAKAFYSLTNEQGVISQRLGDLKQRRRTKESNQRKYNFQPTLPHPIWGDISMAMPAKHLENLLEAIDTLDNVIPGIAADYNIWHGPEMKFHGLQIPTNEYLKAKEDIYVAGDGSGYTRGIVGAAASGLLAAEGIKKEL